MCSEFAPDAASFDAEGQDAERMASPRVATAMRLWPGAFREEDASDSKIDGFSGALRHDPMEHAFALT